MYWPGPKDKILINNAAGMVRRPMSEIRRNPTKESFRIDVWDWASNSFPKLPKHNLTVICSFLGVPQTDLLGALYLVVPLCRIKYALFMPGLLQSGSVDRRSEV